MRPSPGNRTDEPVLLCALAVRALRGALVRARLLGSALGGTTCCSHADHLLVNSKESGPTTRLCFPEAESGPKRSGSSSPKLGNSLSPCGLGGIGSHTSACEPSAQSLLAWSGSSGQCSEAGPRRLSAS